MPVKNEQLNFAIIIILLFVAIFIAFLLLRPTSVSSFIPYLIVIAPVIFLIALFNTDIALILLIFSMLLSPEIVMGGVRSRAVVVRFDDIFIFVTFFGWMAKMAINKELGFAKVTPINKSIVIYVFIYIIATLIGILAGSIRPLTSIFYMVKYFEYFLLYIMVVNCLKDRKQIRFFVYSILLVGLIISMYAFFMHFSGAARVTAPFEGTSGEPNTLGGYLLLMMMIAIGVFLNVSSIKLRGILALGICVAFPAFLFTLSRGSWFSFIPAYIFLLFLSRKGKFLLLSVSLFLVLQFSIIFPIYVYNRIEYTFATQTTRNFFGREITMDESSAARWDVWKNSISHWSRSPIIGHGASSAGSVVDNQYMRVLIEVGIIGLIAFLLLLFAVFKASLKTLRVMRDEPFEHGLTVGFIAGFVGLLVHSLGAATFILIRIMEPFWFLAAIVICLPKLRQERDWDKIT
ncbi:MAG: O-antigen ligase family protein [Candidatus Pacebacteria bacterium]|nr:O-antigen ligase family protein [Candidatus Paceibacterota bacterium]